LCAKVPAEDEASSAPGSGESEWRRRAAAVPPQLPPSPASWRPSSAGDDDGDPSVSGGGVSAGATAPAGPLRVRAAALLGQLQARTWLYAVLVHSGSALGGHYYAYIRDLCADAWRTASTSASVTPATEDEVMAMAGSERRAGGYGGGSSTNAYMLMYRRVLRAPYVEEIARERGGGESGAAGAAGPGGGGAGARGARRPARLRRSQRRVASAARAGARRGPGGAQGAAHRRPLRSRSR